jgi:multiple sugar transport system permease protein
MYFLPYITSSVAIALIFGTLFSRNFGVVNVVISCLSGLPGLSLILPAQSIDWLGSYSAIKPAISFVLFWRYLGWNIVLYLAALQTIPAELYEAARLDGATAWMQFRHVSLPLLKPMMYFAVSMTVIGNLQIFEEPFILVGPAGGPAQAALTATMYMYRTAFNFNDFGAAAAMSWIVFVLICLAMLICRRLLGGENAGALA